MWCNKSSEISLFFGRQSGDRAPLRSHEWIDAPRLETVIDEIKAEELLELGYALGTILALIHKRQYSETGYLDKNLQVECVLDLTSRGLLEYAKRCLAESPARDRLGKETTAVLLDLIEEESGILGAH